MPTKFIDPIKASVPAAVTSEMPWSMEWGMRWVPIRPVEVAPQTKKLPARSQNSGTRSARDMIPPSRTLPPAARAGAGPAGAAAGAPKGRSPTSAGSLRIRNKTGTRISAATAASSRLLARQPISTTEPISTGTNTS